MKETIAAMDWNGIIKKYFVDLVEIVKSGVDFASEQVPLYLKELIAYEFWSSTIHAVVYALVTLLCVKVFFHCRKRWNELKNDDGVPYVMCGLVCVALSILFTCNTVGRVDDAIKAAVAPRVIIVEKIQSLIKETNSDNSCGRK